MPAARPAQPGEPAAAGDGIGALLGRVRRLELVARRNAAGLLPGDYSSAVLGRGMLFHEARRYVPGEPARGIDWNISARLGEPFVRVHLEERQRDVVLALDVSPSMHAGFQALTKLEYAVELAATLAVSAIDAGDRLGWVMFADRVLEASRPAGGRAQLFRALAAMLRHTAAWRRRVEESDPRSAIHAIEGLGGRQFVVFLISDFIDHDVPDDLRFLRARHDAALLHVYDPLEYGGIGPLLLDGEPAEGRRTSQPLPRAAGGLDEMQAFLRREAARYRMAVSSFSTALPVATALGAFFHRRRRMLR